MERSGHAWVAALHVRAVLLVQVAALLVLVSVAVRQPATSHLVQVPVQVLVVAAVSVAVPPVRSVKAAAREARLASQSVQSARSTSRDRHRA